jgi:hypothetical protein
MPTQNSNFISKTGKDLSDIFWPLSKGGVSASATNFYYHDTSSSTNKDLNKLYSGYISGDKAAETGFIVNSSGEDLKDIFQNINVPPTVTPTINYTGNHDTITLDAYSGYTTHIFYKNTSNPSTTNDIGTISVNFSCTGYIILVGGGGRGGNDGNAGGNGGAIYFNTFDFTAGTKYYYYTGGPATVLGTTQIFPSCFFWDFKGPFSIQNIPYQKSNGNYTVLSKPEEYCNNGYFSLSSYNSSGDGKGTAYIAINEIVENGTTSQKYYDYNTNSTYYNSPLGGAGSGGTTTKPGNPTYATAWTGSYSFQNKTQRLYLSGGGGGGENGTGSGGGNYAGCGWGGGKDGSRTSQDYGETAPYGNTLYTDGGVGAIIGYFFGGGGGGAGAKRDANSGNGGGGANGCVIILLPNNL